MNNPFTRCLQFAPVSWLNSIENGGVFRLFYRIFLCLCIMASIACRADETTLTLGKISQDPAKQLQTLLPMAEYLSSSLTDSGYSGAAGAIFPDFESARQALAAGEVDLLTLSLYEAAQVMRNGDAVPLAVKWKKELSGYSSIIIVRSDSNIYEISDLRGHTIGFEDAGSTSAYFLPMRAIEMAGLTLVPEGESASAEDAVYFRFTGSEQNSSALLFRSRIDAIALSDYDWLKTDHVPDSQREQFRIIHVSQTYPRALEVVRATIPETVQHRLQQTLTSMHLNPQLNDIMDTYHETSRFSPLDSQSQSQLEEIVEFIQVRGL